MSGEASSTSSDQCLVCATPNNSLHFGMDVCRACSSFFKRAQQSGQRIPCRKGDQQCAITRGEVPMCRGCRYARCLELGISCDVPERRSKTSSTEAGEPSSSSSSSSTKESLLDRIAREHAACVERQKLKELELVKKYKLQRLSHPTEEVYLATHDYAITVFNLHVFESWNLLLSAFPSIRDLDYEDKREFYRLCMPLFGMIDNFCRTKRIWGGFEKYAMCTELACTDNTSPDSYLGPEEGGAMREDHLESIRTYLSDQQKLVLPSFEKADIREREKYALLALILSESDPQSDFVDRFQPFLEEVRSEILENLHQFYTEEMGLTDYSARLCNLWTICHTFREGHVLFQEFFRMQVIVFDMYETEKMLQDLIL